MTLGRSGVGGDDFCHGRTGSHSTESMQIYWVLSTGYLLLTAVELGFESFQVRNHNLATIHPYEFFGLESA